MKKAFTLIELIAVIVVVGLLSIVGINVVKNLYLGYLQARSVNTLETQTELTLEQIAKRLAFRIKSSTIGRQSGSPNSFISVSDSRLNSRYDILEWISYSYESFQVGGWSGFVDMSSTETKRDASGRGGFILTPGSDLDLASQYISDLTNKKATLDNNKIGLMFKKQSRPDIQTAFGYNASHQADEIAIAGRAGTNNQLLRISNYTSNQIYEQYYLLHTAYAVVPQQQAGSTDIDLWLHYNYRPWLGAGNKYNDGSTSKSLLAKNVTRFNFIELNGMIVIKLCIRDAGKSLGEKGAETTICKIKAIY